jgi:ADP-ribosylglycohydrolase
MLRAYITGDHVEGDFPLPGRTEDDPRDPFMCSDTLYKLSSAATSDESQWHNISGFSTDTLCAAMYCFFNTETFKECVLTAVNLGGDTDSVGAVAGQIAGAYYGLSGIPRKFIDGLQDSERFLMLAEQLFNLYGDKNEN